MWSNSRRGLSQYCFGLDAWSLNWEVHKFLNFALGRFQFRSIYNIVAQSPFSFIMESSGTSVLMLWQLSILPDRFVELHPPSVVSSRTEGLSFMILFCPWPLCRLGNALCAYKVSECESIFFWNVMHNHNSKRYFHFLPTYTLKVNCN